MPHAQVRQLLDDVGSAPACPDNTNTNAAERFLAIWAEKALTTESISHGSVLLSVMGLPTIDTSENLWGFCRSVGCQRRPAAESWLRTTAPCGMCDRA